MLKEHAAPRSLSEAIRYFADPDTALWFVVNLRWPSGVSCPLCDTDNPSYLRSRRIWKCRNAKCAKRQFSVKVGTIFEDSPLGLDKWLPALWLLANAKNGISSYELGRALGVTQKTAWFMLGRIRLAMQSKSFKKLRGEVEVDESFFGGLSANMHKDKRRATIHGSGWNDKQAVMGMLQRKRGGKHSVVRFAVIPNIQKKTLVPLVQQNVEAGSSVYTDKHHAYKYIGPQYRHAAVDHAVEYVRGRVHTNGLENFWSLMKRTIKGTYISVDPFHLFRYLDEQSQRFNLRKLNDLGRFVFTLKNVLGKRLTYRELISADMTPATT